MKINFTHKGNFNKLERFLARVVKIRPVIDLILHKYGRKGVEALSAATPKESGKTAESWSYEIEHNGTMSSSIVWKNSNINEGCNIAILLQYGHGTGTGGFVKGTDYINPAIEGLFKQMADECWEEVTSVG